MTVLIQFMVCRTQVSVLGFQGSTLIKNLPASARDAGDTCLIPGSGRSPGGGNGNSLQYFCLGNPMDWSLAGNSPWGRKKSDTSEGTRAQKHKEPKYLYARSLKIIFMGYH